MKIGRRAAIFLDRVLTCVLQGMAALFLLSIIGTVGYQVFARYVLKRGVAWGEELPLVLNVWFTWVGAALVLRYRGHVAIEFLAKAMPDRLRRWVIKGGQIVIFGFSVILFWQGCRLTSNAMSYKMATLPVPMGYFYLSVPIGAAAMTFFSLGEFCGWLEEKRPPE